MNAREALNSAVDALEKMGFVVLSRFEVEEMDKEIAALREALEMIANRELSLLSECRDIASEALARNAGGNDDND